MIDDQGDSRQTASDAVRPLSDPHNNRSVDRIAVTVSHILERTDTFIYSAVGLCFLIGALFSLVYSIWDFTARIQGATGPITNGVVASAVIQFISDLLLVLIIMEVLSTVLHYLRDRATSLRPFLFIGIISATRSILSIGARLSVAGSNMHQEEFNRAMIELGVSATVVLALGITIKLLGREAEITTEMERHL